jgi:hypothetical protein
VSSGPSRANPTNAVVPVAIGSIGGSGTAAPGGMVGDSVHGSIVRGAVGCRQPRRSIRVPLLRSAT